MESQKPMSVASWEAILVIVVTFFVFLFVSTFVFVFFGKAVAVVVGELLILIVPLMYLIMKRVDVKKFVKLDLNPKYILLGIGLSVLLIFLNIAVSELLTYVFGVSETVERANQEIISLAATPTGFAAITASLALAGICEEFAFRGFLQNTLFKALSTARSQAFAFAIATTISAAIFGLFHFDPQLVYILAAFTTGLALGYIFHRWNYTTAATAHASMNLIVLALLLMIPV